MMGDAPWGWGRVEADVFPLDDADDHARFYAELLPHMPSDDSDTPLGRYRRASRAHVLALSRRATPHDPCHAEGNELDAAHEALDPHERDLVRAEWVTATTTAHPPRLTEAEREAGRLRLQER